MRLRTGFICLLVALLIVPAGAQDTTNNPNKETSMQAIASQTNEFTFDMYRQLQESSTGNLVYSPYSISQAAAMVYAGAEADTEQEIADTLHFNQPTDDLLAALRDTANALTPADGSDVPEDERFQLNVANAVWGQADFPWREAYLTLLEQTFGSELNTVDYQTGDAMEIARQINAWVAEQTNDNITDIISPQSLDALTRMVLVNAIYFNAKWASPFEAHQTRPQRFTLLDGETVDVDMMNQTGSFGYTEGDGYQALSMDYRNTSTAMLLILPDDFEAFEESFGQAQFNTIYNSLERGEGQVSVPKFDFDSSIPLTEVLQSLGMERAFSPDAANFTGMIEENATLSENLFLTDAVHKATITVDEEGTEAAAATGMALGATSMPMVTFTFRADRPFLFVIYDTDSGLILFNGRVLDPTA